jgi:hypothetical protein
MESTKSQLTKSDNTSHLHLVGVQERGVNAAANLRAISWRRWPGLILLDGPILGCRCISSRGLDRRK